MMDNNEATAPAHSDDEKPCKLLIHYGERVRTAEGKVGWGLMRSQQLARKYTVMWHAQPQVNLFCSILTTKTRMAGRNG